LKEPDLDRWDREQIQGGLEWLAKSAESDRFSRYHAFATAFPFQKGLVELKDPEKRTKSHEWSGVVLVKMFPTDISVRLSFVTRFASNARDTSFMAPIRSFLIVNDDSHARSCISATLLRHYPEAVAQECLDLNTAVEVLRSLSPDQGRTVVIAHQTPQASGTQLIVALRAAHSSVPIIWTGEPNESALAKSAGATEFLDKHAWLLIGTVVRRVIEQTADAA